MTASRYDLTERDIHEGCFNFLDGQDIGDPEADTADFIQNCVLPWLDDIEVTPNGLTLDDIEAIALAYFERNKDL